MTENTANVSLDSFFTLDKANVGREFLLVLPSGEPSGHSLTVLSRHSDAVHSAMEAAQRKRLQNAMKPESERITERQINLPVIAAMIGGWTLPDEFTPENALKLVQNAPQIAEAVDRFSWNDSHFFTIK